MKWQRRVTVTILMALLALILVTSVLAKGPKGSWTEAEGFWFPSLFGSPDKVWFPGQDRIQSRGRWQGMMVFSDDERLQGDWVFYFDEHFDSDFSGHWNGEFHAEIMTADGPGTWDGHFHGECYGLWDGSGSIIYANGQGGGAMEGGTVKAEFVETSEGETEITAQLK